MGKGTRPSWDEYFMEIMEGASKRATCDRGRSACVIVNNNRIIATGYVGAPSGLPHCDDVGHAMKGVVHEDGRITKHCVRTVHAEQNAICQAARTGVALEGATLYCRMTPCADQCALMIINCGIKRVVCQKKYHLPEATEKMFKKIGIELVYMSEKTEEYENQK